MFEFTSSKSACTQGFTLERAQISDRGPAVDVAVVVDAMVWHMHVEEQYSTALLGADLGGLAPAWRNQTAGTLHKIVLEYIEVC